MRRCARPMPAASMRRRTHENEIDPARVFDRLRDALGAARMQLDTVRDNIATLKEYREKIDGSPVDQNTIEAPRRRRDGAAPRSEWRRSALRLGYLQERCPAAGSSG